MKECVTCGHKLTAFNKANKKYGTLRDGREICYKCLTATSLLIPNLKMTDYTIKELHIEIKKRKEKIVSQKGILGGCVNCGRKLTFWNMPSKSVRVLNDGHQICGECIQFVHNLIPGLIMKSCNAQSFHKTLQDATKHILSRQGIDTLKTEKEIDNSDVAFQNQSQNGTNENVLDQIEKLFLLKEKGIISEEEFNKKKKILLNRI